jgi:hypothetical protein
MLEVVSLAVRQRLIQKDPHLRMGLVGEGGSIPGGEKISDSSSL